jgi:hypothetical protein
LLLAAIVPQEGQFNSSLGTASPQFLQVILSSLLATVLLIGFGESGLDLSRAYTKDQKWLSASNLSALRLTV